MDNRDLPHIARPRPVPAHTLNGHSPLRPTARAERDRVERDRAAASIQSSMGRHKAPIDLNNEEAPPPFPRRPGQSAPRTELSSPYEEVPDEEIDRLEPEKRSQVEHYEVPLTPPATSRSHSPFTATPTVDFDGLSWPSTGTLARLHEHGNQEEAELRLQKLSGAVRTILECIGEDPDREGLHGTPERYAKALMFFTKGYEENLRNIVNGAVFQEDHDELVIVKDIEVYSLCEHHLVPFIGKVSRCTFPRCN